MNQGSGGNKQGKKEVKDEEKEEKAGKGKADTLWLRLEDNQEIELT